ncbi:MAG: hypothetical protein ARM1_0191 [Candidatus Micrarchaeota archaeon]|nr:MAG: hypothetical protein ARM1_0191 [Candidatus Micrarchaeota archaeon]
MVEIEYKPVSKIVIHNIVKMSVEELVLSRITPQGAFPLYWTDGILWSFSNLPLTEKVINDYINGIDHWAVLQFSIMSNYKDELSVGDNNMYKVKVLNTTDNDFHIAIIRWLRSNILEKDIKFKGKGGKKK